MADAEQATLRGRALGARLGFWRACAGKRIRMELHSGSSFDATLVAINSRFDELLVRDLHTPLGVYKRALVRASELRRVLVEGAPAPPP